MAVLDHVRAQMLRRIGLEDLLTTHAGEGSAELLSFLGTQAKAKREVT
jgi:hypothetical protein